MDILTSNKNEAKLNTDLVSFDDCPNHCVNGRIFDPYVTHKMKPCPYCEEKRKELIKGNITDRKSGKNIREILNIPEMYTGSEFNEDIIIPDFAKKVMIESSVDKVINKMRELITDITIGNLPRHSVLFNLGKKCNELNFIYPYLLKGYISGISLLPLINVSELCQLRLAYEGSSYSVNLDKDYNYLDLINRDLCVIVIDAGATFTNINAVKGLMQLRAQKMKPTIIFTNYWGSNIFDICNEDDDNFSYNLATLYSIEYTDSYKEKQSKTVSSLIESQTQPTPQNKGFGLTSNAMRDLMTSKNTL